MKRIRVLIVEDSAVVREHLRRIVSSDDRFEVAGMAATGEEAIGLVQRVSPDVITMDIHLPGIQGLDATRQIMAIHPTPIVIVSGVEGADTNLSMQALRAGALSVVEKPPASSHDAYDAIARRLRTQLAIMSEVKVVRQREFAGHAGAPSPDPPMKPADRFRILAIAASTGGPNALLQLLTGLGAGFPLPIAIVQHMTPAFQLGFAQWLSSVTLFSVSVVAKATALEPRTVYLAEPEHHLIVKASTAMPDSRPPLGGHRPAGTYLFSSVAKAYGPGAIGVILTGMGDDGAAGLTEMKAAGAFTIAEAESTAVVYGMPSAAVQLGGVCESHPIGDIAGRVLELVAANGRAK